VKENVNGIKNLKIENVYLKSAEKMRFLVIGTMVMNIAHVKNVNEIDD
jgi:hypothetical protein